MTRRQLLKLIEEGEGLITEFKQRFSTHEKIAKEVIALANTRGGYIIFGVNDDKSICGVESEKGEAELIKLTAENYCEPPVNYKLHYLEYKDKELVIMEIPESDVKPHRIQDYLPEFDIRKAGVYVRVNEMSMLASKEMIKILQAQASGKSLKHYEIGKNEKIAFEYLDTNNTISVKELSKLANISTRRASRALIKLVRANLLMIHSKDNGEDYFTYVG
ncbi:MAG: ATP-binding protein [Ignavibacteriae bacterium]|nr:ATP-binding protein [Ignavibacteriota bacterium]NOG99738.1 ATP-binding protein [Ignavibacteriota bacterium]